MCGVFYAQHVVGRTRFSAALGARVAVLVLIATAAGCGGSEAAQPTTPVPVLVEPVVAESPMETALGFPSDPGLRQYQLIEQQRAADQQMVRCMEAAGFFYAVRPAQAGLVSGAFVSDGSAEWTEANGFGITSTLLSAQQAPETTARVDPVAANRDYVASLTAEEAAAYDLALIGDAAAAPTESGEFAPGGCWAESFTDIVQKVALVDEFDVELAALSSRLNADPRVAAFSQSWSSCMQESGYNFANEQALVDDIYARLLQITGTQGASDDSATTTELDELLAFERAAAVASRACRQSFEADYAELRNDYEQEFLDDNRFRIADLITPQN